MNSDGSYRYLAEERTEEPINAQELLQHEAEMKAPHRHVRILKESHNPIKKSILFH